MILDLKVKTRTVEYGDSRPIDSQGLQLQRAQSHFLESSVAGLPLQAELLGVSLYYRKVVPLDNIKLEISLVSGEREGGD